MLLPCVTGNCGHRTWPARPQAGRVPCRRCITCTTCAAAGQQQQPCLQTHPHQQQQQQQPRVAALRRVPGPRPGRRRMSPPLVRQPQPQPAAQPQAQPPAAATAVTSIPAAQDVATASNGSSMLAQQQAQQAADSSSSNSAAGSSSSTPPSQVQPAAAAAAVVPTQQQAQQAADSSSTAGSGSSAAPPPAQPAATVAVASRVPAPRLSSLPRRPQSNRLPVAAAAAARPPAQQRPRVALPLVQQQQQQPSLVMNNPIDGQAFAQQPQLATQQQQRQQLQQQQLAATDDSSMQAAAAHAPACTNDKNLDISIAARINEGGPTQQVSSSSKTSSSSSSAAVESSSSSDSSTASRLQKARQLMRAAMSKDFSSSLWDAANLQEWNRLEAEIAQDADAALTDDVAVPNAMPDSASTVLTQVHETGGSSSSSSSGTSRQSNASSREHAVDGDTAPSINSSSEASSSCSKRTSSSSTASSTNRPGSAGTTTSVSSPSGRSATRSRSRSTNSIESTADLQPSHTSETATPTTRSSSSSRGDTTTTSSSSSRNTASMQAGLDGAEVSLYHNTSSSNRSDSGNDNASPCVAAAAAGAAGAGAAAAAAENPAVQGGCDSSSSSALSSVSSVDEDVCFTPASSPTTSNSSSSTARRRVKTSNGSNGSNMVSNSSLAAVAQIVAGQRDLAAAQRRANSSDPSAAAAAAGNKKRQKTSTNAAAGSSSSAEKPGDVSQLLGKWVLTGFEEDKAALNSMVPALQTRLRSAVEAEQQHEEAMLKALYNQGSLKRLQKDGLVLLGLQALPHSVLYSSMVWRFSAKHQGHQLPYHRFRQGDSLLISRINDSDAVTANSSSNSSRGSSSSREGTSSRSDGNSDTWHDSRNGSRNASSSHGSGGVRPGKDGGMRPIDATVLEARKEHLLLTVDKSDSDLMQRLLAQAPAAALVSWRLDQSVRDTTARRQFDAINRLKHLRVHDSAFEQLLRYCLVGTPSGHFIASLPPVWVRDPAWRADVRALLQNLENLNSSQKKAIAQAVVRSLTLWQGPPGTGKTRTLLALVEVLVKTALLDSSRWQAMGPLLACADTNAAVDNLVEGLLHKGLKVVRIGQPAKVRAELRCVTLEALAEATPLGQRAAALRATSKALFERAKLAAEGSLLGWAGSSSSSAVIPSARSAARSKGRASAAVAGFPAAGVGLLDSDALEADAKRNWAKAEQMTREAAQLILSEAHVVCATCSGAGDPVLSDLHFNVVIIDEATQATEPATLVPLTQGVQCAVMAGDPAQLPPTIVSREAYKYELDRTLFDRLQQVVGIAPLLLDTQYRMNPAISQFPSRWFYGGRLKDGVSAASKPPAAGIPWPVADAPVLMVAINGLEEKAEKSGQKISNGRSAGSAGSNGAPADLSVSVEAGLEDASYRNLPEARVALQALHALMSAGDAASGAILTPYKGQVRSLEYGLRVLAPYFAGMDVSVSSVDGYQGREADVIVFSAVRCNAAGKIGFVSDPRRLNVAITRPRRGLVVVCSPQTLSKGSEDWRAFVQTCQEQEWIAGPEQVPTAAWQADGMDPFAARPAVAASGGVAHDTWLVGSGRIQAPAVAESLGSV